jgi:hypothetical protein
VQSARRRIEHHVHGDRNGEKRRNVGAREIPHGFMKRFVGRGTAEKDSGNPLGFTSARRDPAIERYGQFQLTFQFCKIDLT